MKNLAERQHQQRLSTTHLSTYVDALVDVPSAFLRADDIKSHLPDNLAVVIVYHKPMEHPALRHDCLCVGVEQL